MANHKKILLNQQNISANNRVSDKAALPEARINKRKQIIRLYLTAILLLSMMFTLYVWQSTKMIEIKLRIQKADKTIADLENSNSDLRAEISKLQSISRIETYAKNELGMIIPKTFISIEMPESIAR
ncbi:MAG: hypothetical protein Kow0029_08730 [Candidatus Rifleibacteriota bacterium]